jgi:hypothetical protein
MAKSPTQRLNELEPLLKELNGLIKALRLEVDELGAEQQRTASAVTGLKTVLDDVVLKVAQLQAWKDSLGSFVDMKADIAVLKAGMDDLKKRSEEWGRKLWMIVPVVIGVILTFLLGYYFGKK